MTKLKNYNKKKKSGLIQNLDLMQFLNTIKMGKLVIKIFQ